MKTFFIAVSTLALSTSVFANTFKIDLHTQAAGECEASVAKVVKGLQGTPVTVTMSRQFGDCNATLTATGEATVLLQTYKYENKCSDGVAVMPELSDAAYLNVYTNPNPLAFGGCVIDAIRFKGILFPRNPTIADFCNSIVNQGCDFAYQVACSVYSHPGAFQTEAVSVCRQLEAGGAQNCSLDIDCVQATVDKTYSSEEVSNCAAISDAQSLVSCLKAAGRS